MFPAFVAVNLGPVGSCHRAFFGSSPCRNIGVDFRVTATVNLGPMGSCHPAFFGSSPRRNVGVDFRVTAAPLAEAKRNGWIRR